MKLSIITINYNNALGLRKTLNSVAQQIFSPAATLHSPIVIEHVIIDGASSDESVLVIKEYVRRIEEYGTKIEVTWVSEPDKGIYNAMNKGIRMATGEYIEVLNSGDWLAATNVVERMVVALERAAKPTILYGNMLKVFSDGKILRDTCKKGEYTPSSFYYFYRGTLNHDCAYIRRSLFEKYGMYDEQMYICSDWKWYVEAIALGGENAVYVNIDVTFFDMLGVSENNGKNKDIIYQERRGYLESVLPKSVLRDYDTFSCPIDVYLRLKRHHLWGIVRFLERVLFKFEKWKILNK